MEKLTSILVIVDPQHHIHRTLMKALTLARRFGARLELFLCDSERAYVLKHSYIAGETARGRRAFTAALSAQAESAQPPLYVSDIDEARQACLADGRRYLEALKESLNASDVQISVDVACHSPLYESIVQKVKESEPDLVIKAASGRHPMRRISLDDNDWQLARSCPVSLMLTRVRQWEEPPRFAAAVDVSHEETRAMARLIVRTADYLAVGCQGKLNLVYSESEPDFSTEQDPKALALRRLAYEHRIDAAHTHVLLGEAQETLPAFAARQNYDVMVMGALTHRRGLAALMGTLTSKLVEVLDCDFVLVKPENFSRQTS